LYPNDPIFFGIMKPGCEKYEIIPVAAIEMEKLIITMMY
jgi:hypothetical protein